MLLELAVGDAYGAGFEYAPDAVVAQHNNLAGYIQHQKHQSIKPGHYTDDTQMSIAIAELIAEDARWDQDHIAEKFVQVFKRDQRTGYAGHFYQLLTEIRDGQELLARLEGNNKSDKSGGAMRAIPLGVFGSVEEVLDKCETQAKITHDTPDGIHAAQASSLMSFYFLNKAGPRKELGHWIAKHVPGQWDVPYTDAVGAKGWMSVRAAITAITQCETLADLLKTCIAFTGDVDTVAAVAMGAASLSAEVTPNIPEHLVSNLENGPYGRTYLIHLDKLLLA